MIRALAQVALLVREYEEAIEFYCGKLGFELVEDTELAHKRWVRLRAPGGQGAELVLSRAADPGQAGHIGAQAGGRVFLYLHTDSFDSDLELLRKRGVRLAEEPRSEPYGKVAVIQDLYGNRIDLIMPLLS